MSFLKELVLFLQGRGEETKDSLVPVISGHVLDLHALYMAVATRGGAQKVRWCRASPDTCVAALSPQCSDFHCSFGVRGAQVSAAGQWTEVAVAAGVSSAAANAADLKALQLHYDRCVL